MRKQKKFTAALLWMAAVLILLAGCGADSSVTAVPQLLIPMAGDLPPEIDHNIMLSTADTQTTAELYRFVEPPADPESVLNELASIFGLSADAQRKDFGDLIIMNDDDKVINYEPAAGTWSFQDAAYNKKVSHALPTEEESADIARNFLIENGLYNERFSAETVAVQYSGSEFDETYAPYCNAVYFYPRLNGRPILGVSRIVVSVGEDGQIIEVLKYYKDFAACGEIELAAPMSFAAGIQSNQYSTSINSNAVSSEITEVELAYWEDSGSCEDQPFLQPVWVFSGTSTQADGTEESFNVIVQAAKYVED